MRAPARLRRPLALPRTSALPALGGLLSALTLALTVSTLPAEALPWEPGATRAGAALAPLAREVPREVAVALRAQRADARAAARARSQRARARSLQAWSGYAFDACRAPSSRVMDRWRAHSPFLGVGIYIGGALRACPQKHLTRRWVARQSAHGWRMLPIWVGPQASCSTYRTRMSARPAAARRQGVRAARGARAAARSLGLPPGTTLWYDLEWFPARQARCRASALHFLGAWTRTVHGAGYRSGVYSSISAGITAVGRVRGRSGYSHPDAVWFAWANGRRDTWLGRDWLRAPRWKADRRVHQYALDVRASYGGVRLAIDRNYVDLGSSPALRRTPAVCGRAADRGHYRPLHRGDRGRLVATAHCLLRSAGALAGPTPDRVDRRTRAAVRRFQHAAGLPRSGRVGERTWPALLASGARPVLKRGSEGPAVRRLQRSLTAALPGSVAVHGHFGPATSAALQRYQRRAGLPVTGVAAAATWQALGRGRLHGSRPHHSKAHRPKGRHDAAHHGPRAHGAGKHAHGQHGGKHGPKAGGHGHRPDDRPGGRHRGG